MDRLLAPLNCEGGVLYVLVRPARLSLRLCQERAQIRQEDWSNVEVRG